MLSQILTERGFVHQASADLAAITDGEKRTVYVGVDPTADSMHVGNLAGLMLLRHFIDDGHKAVLLIGGGTGMIGDPKPDVERPLTDPAIIHARAEKLRTQAEKILGTDTVEFVNNYDWLGSLPLIDFLRDIGKHFTVNNLLKKDAIAARLESEEGISYTEFAYPLLQAYDYLELYRSKGCTVQIGGSDQWGNITAGVDLIRRVEGKEVYAVTLPLVVDKATGKKFGKSEGNAVWLDSTRTSAYAFYQFWLQASDESVADYLRLFTLLSVADIQELCAVHEKDPAQRSAQKALAKEVTRLIHGHAAATAAEGISEILFGTKDFSTISTLERDVLLADAPCTSVDVGMALVDAVVLSGLASSKREARQFIADGGITLNGKKIDADDYQLQDTDFVHTVALLKRGKREARVLARV